MHMREITGLNTAPLRLAGRKRSSLAEKGWSRTKGYCTAGNAGLAGTSAACRTSCTPVPAAWVLSRCNTPVGLARWGVFLRFRL